MNVLILGSGGREHAFAWKLAQSPLLGQLFVAPGNAGTAQWNTSELVAEDFESVATFCQSQEIDLLLVGQEVYLVEGIADFFADRLPSVAVVGPKRAGAMLEGSKQFAKDFMIRYNIPTARYFSVHARNIEQGIDFLKKLSPPFVLKADGLAAGKGVLIEHDRDKAIGLLKDMIENQSFGKASATVVVEEFLSGVELSVFVLTDGRHYRLLPTAKDYKRIGEADTGLNTGGMGAVSPVPFANEEFMRQIETQIIQPTIKGMAEESIPYCGFLYFGLMNVEGNPYVIEYNCRMGDPETQAVIPRIESDLLEALRLLTQGNLHKVSLSFTNQASCTVVLASEGYPGKVQVGYPISGIDEVESLVFQAGTKGNLLTSGGRVLAVTALADSLRQAREKALADCEKIGFQGKYFRRDIGLDLLNS